MQSQFNLGVWLNGKYLVLTPETPTVIRILSHKPVRKLVHFSNGKRSACFGLGCYLCQRKNKPQQRYLVNVWDVADRKVKVWDFPERARCTLVEQVLSKHDDPRQYNIAITRHGNGGGTQYRCERVAGAIPTDLDGQRLYDLEKEAN